MLRLAHLSKSFGGNVVLDDVSFEIADREKVGFVGANGAGKSTLLKIVAGQLDADSGTVQLSDSGTEVSYLPQDAGVRSGRTLWGEMLSAFPDLQTTQQELSELETAIADAATEGDDDRLQELIDQQGSLLDRFDQLGGYRVEADIATILAGLGFASTDRDKPTADFSGGWQMRIALAKLLVRKPGLLLLDEPTNHLDLAASEWLEGYLAEYPGMILVVSHDRYFLDRVTGRTLELAHGKAVDYRGNYSYFLTESARRRAELGGRLRAAAEVHRAPAWRSSTPPARTPPAPRWPRAASAPWPSSNASHRRRPSPTTSRFAWLPASAHPSAS